MEVSSFSRRSWEVEWKGRYHFFEGIQGNFLNYGLWIGVQIWNYLHWGVRIQTISLLCALWNIGCLRATFGNSYTLLYVYNISGKLELAHAHYEASTMKLPSHSRPHPPPIVPIRSSHSSSKLKQCIQHHLSDLCVTIVATLPTKLVSATFLPRISFVIIMGRRDIGKLFVLPNSQNGSNSDYHDKIY